jgi:hypothetical protein
MSALLLGFPKQFGKATLLSVILKRGSEYKCVKGFYTLVLFVVGNKKIVSGFVLS